MATKPLRPCQAPGCPRLTSGSRCHVHAVAYARQEAARLRVKGRQRSASVRRAVDARDQRICQRCGAQGTQKHHVRPLAKGGIDHESNLVTLCDDCHKAAHRTMARSQA